MNTSGEAAEQVVRMSLEVGEAALKISGKGAKQIAVLLYAILNEQKKTRGKARMETLVRSGKPLTVFSVKEKDMRKFVEEAKRYGILYCAIRDPKGSSDGIVDIMVKEEDAPRINRIVERFKFATVTEAAQIKTEIQRAREEKITGKSHDVPEKERPDKVQADKLVEKLLGKPIKKEDTQMQNPSLAKTENSHLSEPISGRQNKTARDTSDFYHPSLPDKPSVRKEIREIKEVRRKEKEKNTPNQSNKTFPQKQHSRQNKKKQSKER